MGPSSAPCSPGRTSPPVTAALPTNGSGPAKVLLHLSAHGEVRKPAQLPDQACGQLCKINYRHLIPSSVLYKTLSLPQFPFLNIMGWITSLSLFVPSCPGHFKYHSLSGSLLQWVKKEGTWKRLFFKESHCHRSQTSQ